MKARAREKPQNVQQHTVDLCTFISVSTVLSIVTKMVKPMFTATFKIAEIDMSDDPKTGQRIKLKKFESVSRLRATSKDAKDKLEIVLDFNCDIYPLNDNDKVGADVNRVSLFVVVLTTSQLYR